MNPSTHGLFFLPKLLSSPCLHDCSDSHTVRVVRASIGISWEACGQFVFRRNAVLNGRRFGVLAKGQQLAITDNTFVGLGSGAVQYLNSATEGLCARDAVVLRNTVRDVGQLAQHGFAPKYAPLGAFWAATIPSTSPPCHRNLLFADNVVDSGPHAITQFESVSGARVERTHATRCGREDVASWGTWEQWAGGVDNTDVSIAPDNMVMNSSSARLCSKRAQLVTSTRSEETSVYFLSYRFEAYVERASIVLHKLSSCMQCGEHLCATAPLCASCGALIKALQTRCNKRTPPVPLPVEWNHLCRDRPLPRL